MRVGRVVSIAIGGAAVVVPIAAAPDRLVSLLSKDGRADAPGVITVVTRVRQLAIAAGCGLIVLGALAPVWRRAVTFPHLMDWMRSITIAVASLTAAFVCVSPYSLRKLAFLKGLYFAGTRLSAASMSQAAAE